MQIKKPKKSFLKKIHFRKVLIWVGGIIGIIILASLCEGLWSRYVFPPVKDPAIGVSFSETRSVEMGLDWKANYTALLDDMKVRNFRLMSYWDIHEATQGTYDFSTLDWQINEATKRGATVSLAIGLRQPRWPECHEPNWAYTLDGGAWKQALYAYIQAVVKRYENNPTVINWQLENEGMNNWFGKCDPPDRQRLIEEFNMVKSISKKPVWMSLSDQQGLPLGGPTADKFGYSIYRVVWNNMTGPFKFYIVYPVPLWYHRLRAVLIQLINHRDIFIHELQLEPWGPEDTTKLSVDEQNKSMSTQQIHDNLMFGEQVGAKDIYTWGGEWWYWRKVNGDPSIWNKVKQEFDGNQERKVTS